MDMNAWRWRQPGNWSLALVALWLLGANGSALAATTTVYKCFDRNLNVLYSDEPCRGEQMNVKTSDADPAALAELQRERDALARSTAQRIADSHRAALERASTPQFAYPAGDDLGTYGGGVYVPAYAPYGYAGMPPSRPKRFHAAAIGAVKPVVKPRVVANPPRMNSPR
jgi:uncharacterized protein DUF4124